MNTCTRTKTHRMIAPALLVAACLAVLSGCNETPSPTQAGSTATTPAAGTPPPVAAVPTPPPQAATAAPTETAKDSAATDPKGALSAQEESKSMPMAGHGNNHSSPALGTDTKK